MTVPVLPGSLRDLLAVGMAVTAQQMWLHSEFDPDVWRTRSGVIHTVDGDHVGTVAVGVKGRPDGLILDKIHLAEIHDCEDETCLYRPQITRAADVRYTARWCLRVVGRGRGRLTDHDRQLVAIATTLLTKAVC